MFCKVDKIFLALTVKHRKCSVDEKPVCGWNKVDHLLEALSVRKRFSAGEYEIAFRSDAVHELYRFFDLALVKP